MNFTAEELSEITEFKARPQAQLELRDFMREQGASYGRELTALVHRKLPLSVLLSNSGRCEAADLIGSALRKQIDVLRTIGHDSTGIELYREAAKRELAWLGV